MSTKPEQPEANTESKDEAQKGPMEQFHTTLLQKATPEYLQELLMDKKQLQTIPNSFKHVELILEREIAQVRERLFHKNGSIQMNNTDLPDPSGQIVTLQRKVYIPVKENPTYNFVGRLLGPRGLTAKQMEQELGCKIMVRGKGSMRDKRKEDQNRGKPNWEHLQEDLHVLVSVEDYESRAELRLQRAVNAITVFLEQGLRTPEDKDVLKQTQLMELAVLNGADDVKKQQLMELAIMNGTYRDPQQRHNGSSQTAAGAAASASSSPSPLSPSLTFDELEHKERQQAQQQMTAQQQQQLLLQQQYLSMLSSQPAMAAAMLGQAPTAAAAAMLGASGFRFPGSPTLSAAAAPLFLGGGAASAAGGANAAAAAAAGMNLTAVMGGMPAMSTPNSTASGLGGSLSSDQLAAFLGVANGAVSPSSAAGASGSTDVSAQSMAALAAAGFPAGSFSSFLPTTSAAAAAAVAMGDYSNVGETGTNGAGSLKVRNNNVPSMRMHPYLR